MSLNFPQSEISVYNSTTHADLLGVLVGLERFPGEPADRFLERIRKACLMRRDGGRLQVLVELSLQIDEPILRAGAIATTNPARIRVSFAGIQVTDLGGGLVAQAPFVETTEDGFWRWRTVREIRSELSGMPGLQVSLDMKDEEFALSLVPQTNSVWETAIPENGVALIPQADEVDPSRVRIDGDSPARVEREGDFYKVTFQGPSRTGVQAVSWERLKRSLELVKSRIILFSVSDPEVVAAAKLPGSALTYQMREYLDELMRRDRSYWL